MKTKLLLVVLVAAAVGLVLRGCGDDDGGSDLTEYSCTDNRDNDNDGDTDCDDSECANQPICQGGAETNCGDNVDNDSDGQTDCDDTDCANDPGCQGSTETNCTNNIDDDNDTYTDCDDADCANNPACGSTETNCSNNIDDDNDTYTDCDDADCFSNPACQGGTETNCSNNVDDDNDGQTDCADTDCANDQACQGSGAIGDACSSAGQCTAPSGLTAECLQTVMFVLTFPNGYCSAGCDPQNDQCGAGAICATFLMENHCMKTCTDVSQCRGSEGYVCDNMGGLLSSTVCTVSFTPTP